MATGYPIWLGAGSGILPLLISGQQMTGMPTVDPSGWFGMPAEI